MYDEAVRPECYITFIDPRPFPIYESEKKYKKQIQLDQVHLACRTQLWNSKEPQNNPRTI